MTERPAMDATRARLAADVDDQLFTKGVQARISLRGEPVLEVAEGEDGMGRPISPETVFRVYCTAKPVAALAVGLAVERGDLDLDAPLERLLPTFAALQGGVTLRHILTHTAGLARPDGVTVELVPPADRAAYLEQHPRDAATRLGIDPAYSEYAGWHIVGRALEAVAGEPLADHLRGAVLDPLGLADTSIGMSAAQHASVLHRLGVNVDMRALQPFPMLFERTERVCREANPAHGAYTTADDLEALYRATLRAWHGERVAGLPSPDLLREMTADARPRAYDEVLRRECSYGLGFMTTLADHQFGPQCSPLAYGHSGNVGSSFAFADPAHDLVVALVFNGVVDHESAFLRRTALVRAIYQDLGLEEPTPASAASSDDPAPPPGDDRPPPRRGLFRRRPR